MQSRARPTGMLAFTMVWIGQAVSLFGSAMTWFAFTVWAWEVSGQATALSLVTFFSLGPTVLFSPIAGALVDRWNRKRVMMLSDLAAGLSTIAVLLLYASHSLQIWHVYVAAAFTGVFQAFQFPAYSASITMMVPKEQYTRAESMVWLAQSAATVFAPLLAVPLLNVIGIVGVMSIDVITFVAAVGALLFVHIPQPATTQAGQQSQGSLWQESLYGFRYILTRRSLWGLQMVFFFCNLLDAIVFVALPVMILARTGDELVLGSVKSAGALGGIAGGIALGVWGGPKRRIHGVLVGWALTNLLGALPMGLGNTLAMWAGASFLSAFFTPLINGSDQAIWQAKVAPDLQGRVFATRLMLSQLPIPVAMVLGGVLADRVFEPAMQAEGSLVTLFGGLVGTGPGAGMGLMLVLCGLLGVAVGLGGYAVRAVRDIEGILPDYDSAKEMAAQTSA